MDAEEQIIIFIMGAILQGWLVQIPTQDGKVVTVTVPRVFIGYGIQYMKPLNM